MGIEERKTREKEERRALILSKAKALILERGVDSFTMRDVARECELSKATIYLYFESKDGILTEILEKAASAFVEYARSSIPEGASGLRALHALWDSYLNLYGESQDIMVLTGIKNYLDPEFPLDSERGESRFGHAMSRMLDLISAVLKQGMEDGSLEKAADPDKLARTVIMIATTILDSVSRIPRSKRDSLRIDAEMRETFAILLRGLAADGQDPALLRLTAR